jgi:hypothetical protein
VKRVKQNTGYKKFIEKWGMTNSTLSNYYLHRGEKFNGPLPEARVPLVVKVKNYFKKIE